MYSRKTGNMYNTSEAQRKIESFNNELREQYRQHSIQASPHIEKKEKNLKKCNNVFDKLGSILSNEDLIIVGLLILLMLEENKDYLLIGVLAALLVLNR